MVEDIHVTNTLFQEYKFITILVEHAPSSLQEDCKL